MAVLFPIEYLRVKRIVNANGQLFLKIQAFPLPSTPPPAPAQSEVYSQLSSPVPYPAWHRDRQVGAKIGLQWLRGLSGHAVSDSPSLAESTAPLCIALGREKGVQVSEYFQMECENQEIHVFICSGILKTNNDSICLSFSFLLFP